MAVISADGQPTLSEAARTAAEARASPTVSVGAPYDDHVPCTERRRDVEWFWRLPTSVRYASVVVPPLLLALAADLLQWRSSIWRSLPIVLIIFGVAGVTEASKRAGTFRRAGSPHARDDD